MRYMPMGTHSIITWNSTNNCSQAETVARIMIRCNVSVAFIQEPRTQLTDESEEFIINELAKYGLKGYYTKFQFLIYNECLLGPLFRNIKKQMNGRILSCLIQVDEAQDNYFVKLTGCYAIPQGPGIRNCRTKKRKQLYDSLKKCLEETNNNLSHTITGFKSHEHHIIGEVVMGDLQETMTTTTRHNQGETHYNEHRFCPLQSNQGCWEKLDIFCL